MAFSSMRLLYLVFSGCSVDFQQISVTDNRLRAFQTTWYKDFDWLHYDENEDAAFCFTCLKAAEMHSLSTKALSQSDAFTKSGKMRW